MPFYKPFASSRGMASGLRLAIVVLAFCLCGKEDQSLKGEDLLLLHNDHGRSVTSTTYTHVFALRNSISDAELTAVLSKSEYVQELNILHCANLSNLVMPKHFLKNATRIAIFDTPIDDQFFLQLEQCERLQTLILQNTSISREAFERLRWPPAVVTLRIENAPFGDPALMKVRKIKSLRTLMLNGCAVSNKGVLDALPELQLECFSVANTPLDDSCVPGIAKCRGLQMLNISNSGITASGIRMIIESGALESLDISGHRIDQVTLDTISASKTLRYLTARGSFSRIEDLEKLASISNIMSITIAAHDFSEARVLEFHRNFSRLRITF